MNENIRLKKIRIFLDYTQTEFSKKLGIKQGSYSDIERGKVQISYNLLKKIVKEFGVNPTWFIIGKGDMFLSENMKANNIISPEVEEKPYQTAKFITQFSIEDLNLYHNIYKTFEKEFINKSEYTKRIAELEDTINTLKLIIKKQLNN